MKKTITLYCFFAIQFVFSQHIIYVSNSGNDKNEGSQKSPVYSLKTAFKLAESKNNQAIDIKISGGNYFVEDGLVLNESISRTENTKIRVIGDVKNRPVFYGGNRITTVKSNTSDNWVLNISKSANVFDDKLPQILSVDGKQRLISKFPNKGFLKPLDVKYYNQKFVIKIPTELNDLLKSYDETNIKNVYVTFFVKWTNIIRYIQEHNYKDSTITFTGNDFPDYYKVEPNKTLFYVNNIEKKLNSGEWYYKNFQEIIYKSESSDNLKKSIVTLASTEKSISIIGSSKKKISFLEFENIEFNTFGKGLGKLGYFPYQSAAEVDAIIDLKYSTNIIFKNIKVNNISKSAFWIEDGCNDIKIIDSQLLKLGGNAIKVGIPKYGSETDITNNISIINNSISSGGQIYPDAAAVIVFDAFLNTISHNTISDFTYTGISLGWVWGYGKSSTHSNTVSYNHIYNIGKGVLDDMGGIYTLGVSDGTIIEKNVIHDVKALNYGGWGIYTDEGSSGILIKNNLAYNNSSSGYHHHYGRENVVENNIFAFNSEGEVEATKPEEHISLVFKNNILIHNNNNFFINNWNSINKNVFGNIYCVVNKDGKSKNIFTKELNSISINPLLEKKYFYYLVKNPMIFTKTNFKNIDFSQVGVVR